MILQNFDELVELATHGDHRKVNQLTGDLKNKNRQDKDWYSMMPDVYPVFMLGKAAEERFDGRPNRLTLSSSCYICMLYWTDF